MDPLERKRWLGTGFIYLVLMFIYLGSVYHNFFIGDDSFISFRYAENFANGLGLVWNEGERVEGYTNFLLVVLLALGVTIGVTPMTTSTIIGTISGLVVLALISRLSQRSPFPLLRKLWWLPGLSLAVHGSFTAWSSGGLETQLFTVLILTSMYFLLADDINRRALMQSSAAMALAFLCRPDAVVYFGAASIVLGLQGLRRRISWWDLIFGWASPFVAVAATHVLFRYSYYGFLLPNTYYAKVSGVWIDQGLKYLWIFQQSYFGLAIFTVSAVAFALGLWRHLRHQFFLAQFCLLIVYILYTGGDRFEFRFFIAALPLLYLSFFEALCFLSDKIVIHRLRWAAFAVGTGLVFGTIVYGNHKDQDYLHDIGVASRKKINRYATRRVKEGKLLAEFAEQAKIPHTALMSVGGAGAVPYYNQKYRFIDHLGLCDVYIAHKEIKERGTIAHEKHADKQYLYRRRVAFTFPKVREFDLEEAKHCPSNRLCASLVHNDRRLIFSFKTFIPIDEVRELLRHADVSF